MEENDHVNKTASFPSIKLVSPSQFCKRFFVVVLFFFKKVPYTTFPELKNSSYFNKAAILSAKGVMGTKIPISDWITLIYSELQGLVALIFHTQGPG